MTPLTRTIAWSLESSKLATHKGVEIDFNELAPGQPFTLGADASHRHGFGRSFDTENSAGRSNDPRSDKGDISRARACIENPHAGHYTGSTHHRFGEVREEGSLALKSEEFVLRIT